MKPRSEGKAKGKVWRTMKRDLETNKMERPYFSERQKKEPFTSAGRITKRRERGIV